MHKSVVNNEINSVIDANLYCTEKLKNFTIWHYHVNNEVSSSRLEEYVRY